MFGRAYVIAACLALCGFVLAGCGVRGSLEYPKESNAQKNTASAESGQGKAEGKAPKPHQGFILDRLLR
ncbi:MAG: hypothetical protein AAF346_05965 [Pseudomonadota bacterium]